MKIKNSGRALYWISSNAYALKALHSLPNLANGDLATLDSITMLSVYLAHNQLVKVRSCVSVMAASDLFAGTLLNKLFGTTFDVMNESQRRQTTKGS